MAPDNQVEWAVWTAVVLEAFELVIIGVWIFFWSRIIIPRRRILTVLNRIEGQLDEKDAALELSHRENEAILVNALDIGKRYRHSLQRNHEYEAMINELRIKQGLEPLEFEPLVQIQSLRQDLEKKRGQDQSDKTSEATSQK